MDVFLPLLICDFSLLGKKGLMKKYKKKGAKETKWIERDTADKRLKVRNFQNILRELRHYPLHELSLCSYTIYSKKVHC